MKLPKTAYILLWFPKPSETFVFREVRNLQAMGLPLSIFTLYGRITRGLSQEMQAYHAGVERLGLPYLKTMLADLWSWRRRSPHPLRPGRGGSPWRRWGGLEKTGENLWAWLCAFRLARRFLDQKIEHIHAPWAGGPATAAWIASKLSGIPFSFTARAWDIYPPDGALAAKARDAAFIRVNTRRNINYLAEITGVNQNKIHLTYNGIETRFQNQAPVSMSEPIQLMSLGRFVGKKGYEYLIRAVKELTGSGLDFHLLLAGDGPLRGKLEQLADQLGLDRQISFPGFIPYDRVSELMNRADLFVVPSVVDASGDRDGIPNVIMEALLHGLPVIASEVSGIPELIENDHTGLLVPPGNTAALARAILQMANQRETAMAMADRGRARVLDMFDPKKNYQQVIDLFQQYTPHHPSG